MGIFNQQSHSHPFARGIQGASGVGFSLTADRNYDISGKKLTNVSDGDSPSDAVTRKQLDNVTFGSLTQDIDLKSRYNINNNANRTYNQLKLDTKTLVSYGEVKDNFISINKANGMKTYLDMGNNNIKNVKNPRNNKDASNKSYVDTQITNALNAVNITHASKQDLAGYVVKDGSTTMTGNLKMGNKKITGLAKPTANTDAATKKYVDDNSGGSSGSTTSSRLTVDSNIDMKDNYRILNLKAPNDGDEPATKQYTDIRFLFRDGSHPLTGNLHMNNKRILNVPDPRNSDQLVNLIF